MGRYGIDWSNKHCNNDVTDEEHEKSSERVGGFRCLVEAGRLESCLKSLHDVD
jgi:hypothetical protein